MTKETSKPPAHAPSATLKPQAQNSESLLTLDDLAQRRGFEWLAEMLRMIRTAKSFEELEELREEFLDRIIPLK